MTRIEKILMAILVLAIIGTIVFWNDVRSVFSSKEEVVEGYKKDKKDKKDDDHEKKKDEKNEASRSFVLVQSKNIA